MIYHILDQEQSYIELGGDFFDKQHRNKRQAYLIKQLNALGFNVIVEDISLVA